MARNLLKPHPLEPGDTIGIVAPASPFDGDTFLQGIDVLHGMGFATKITEGVFERQGFLAGDDTHRKQHLHDMLSDDEVQAVVCARGGYGTMRLLGALDYGRLREKIKPFVGFSDITALHMALQERAGWVTFHGPMVTTLARCDDATRDAFYHTLTGQRLDGFNLPHARCIEPGTAQGRLVGGNLATLCHLVGTRFAAQFEGAILILEDTSEAPYRIDRMLTQMTLAGAFNGLAGLVLGTFDNCGEAEEMDALMRYHFEPMGIPVVAGAAIGHGGCNFILPLGIQARLDASMSELIFLESAFDG